MSGNNERLNDGFIEVIRDEKIPSKVRLKKAKYLVRLGADVNAMLYGRSAVSWAKETGDEEMVEFLEEKGVTKAKNTECTISIDTSAYITENYIPSSAQRIEIYKKTADVIVPDMESPEAEAEFIKLKRMEQSV